MEKERMTKKSITNEEKVTKEFLKRGIPEGQIKHKENIFTFKKWEFLGRMVRKGEHGVRIITLAPHKPRRFSKSGKELLQPFVTSVFHVTQTEDLPLAQSLEEDA